MSTPEAYNLGPQTDAWKRWIQQQLAAHNVSQKTLAIDIEVKESPQKSEGGERLRAAVSRFVNGVPGELRAWFEVKPARVALLAGKIGLREGDIRSKLDALKRGEVPAEAAWHPDFPGVGRGEIEVRVPVRGRSVEAVAEAIFRDKVERARDSVQPKDPEGKDLARIKVVASPGPLRDSLVRQVVATVRDTLKRLVASIFDRPQAKGDPNESHLRPTVLVLAPGEDSPELQAGQRRISVQIEVRDLDTTPDLNHILPGPWGAVQAAELAKQLARHPSLRGSAEQNLLAYKEFIAKHPQAVGQWPGPDPLIRLLAVVARNGCPADVPSARRLLAQQAWEKARARHEALSPFDLRLLERFCARAALRIRSPGALGGWTSLRPDEAQTLLSGAAQDLLGEAAGRPLRAFIQDLKQSKGKEREESLNRLEKALAADPIEPVLTALCDEGMLTKEKHPWGSTLRISDPVLACICAASGMKADLPDLNDDWTRLMDPDWGVLIEELARQGLTGTQLGERVKGAPPHLSLAAADWLLRHAESGEKVDKTLLVAAWAARLWSHVHRFASHGWFTPAEIQARQMEADRLRRLSWAWADVLPIFTSDPLKELAVWVSPEVRRFVAACTQKTITEKFTRYELREMAPAQHVPSSLKRWNAWWEYNDPQSGLRLLEHSAHRGVQGCIDLLSGAVLNTCAAESRKAHFDFWRESLDLVTRIRWADKAPAADQPEIFNQLVLHWLMQGRFAPQSLQPAARDELLSLAVRIGADRLRPTLEESDHFEDRSGSRSNAGTALYIDVAERLHLVDLLKNTYKNLGIEIQGLRFDLEPNSPFRAWLHPQRDRPPKQTENPIDGLHRWLEEACEERARLRHQIAVALFRLKLPDTLRSRWREGEPAAPSEEAYQTLRHLEGALTLLQAGPSHPALTPTVTKALGQLAEEPPKSPLLYPHWASYLLRCSQLAETGPWHPCYGDAVRLTPAGLLQVLSQPTQNLPAVVTEVLDPADDPGLPSLAEIQSLQRSLRASTAAAEALLDLGDTAPIEAWVTDLLDLSEPNPMPEPIKAAVAARVARKPALLRAAFDQLKARWRVQEAPSTRRDALRDLCEAGATGEPRMQENVVSALLEMDEPTYLTRLALSLPIPQARNPLHSLGTRSLALLRREHQRSQNPRQRLFWALAIDHFEPGCIEAEEALKHWALTDTDPFSGDEHWSRDLDGGHTPALQALLREGAPWAEADWMDGALRNLWRTATTLPIRPSGPDFDRDAPTPQLTFVADPKTFATHPSAPAALNLLIGALRRHSLSEVLLETFRHPPSTPVIEGGSAPDTFTRETCLESWLFSTFLDLAPLDELNVWCANALDREDWRYTRAAHALLDRGAFDAPALSQVARHHTQTVLPTWHLFRRLWPAQVPQALQERLDANIRPPGDELAFLLSEALEPDALDPHAAAEALRRVYAMSDRPA